MPVILCAYVCYNNYYNALYQLTILIAVVVVVFFCVNRQKICEKPQIITDYEAGRGIPNNAILGKIERVIGVKLRGKERGKPMLPPGPGDAKGGKK